MARIHQSANPSGKNADEQSILENVFPSSILYRQLHDMEACSERRDRQAAQRCLKGRVKLNTKQACWNSALALQIWYWNTTPEEAGWALVWFILRLLWFRARGEGQGFLQHLAAMQKAVGSRRDGRALKDTCPDPPAKGLSDLCNYF